MKQKPIFRRCLAVLLCLCMLVPVMGASAFADDDYPYTFPEEDGKPYYQLSAYAYACTDEDVAGKVRYPTNIFRLLDEQGEQTLTYCADAVIFDEYGFHYRTRELKDMTQTAASEKNLRAIVQNSYPFIEIDEMIAKAKAAGLTLHNDVVPHYEMVIISAVQQAIFSYTNPSYTIKYPYVGALVPATHEYYRDLILYYDESYASSESDMTQNESNIRADVIALRDWLKGLTPAAAPDVTVNASFEARIETAGDAYNLTLYNLSDDVKIGADLTVTVKKSTDTVYTESNVTVTADGTISVSFKSDKLDADDEVTVVLTGNKPYEDVVAYESEVKGSTQSQLFIGKGTLYKPFSANNTAKVPAKISISVTKVWSGDGVQPSQVTVHLFADGVDTGKTLTLSAANSWSGSFTGLDATSGGKKIAYTVSEDAVTGYASAVTGDMENGFTITNTSNGIISIRPADITIYMGGEKGYDAVVGSGSETLDTNNSLPTPLFHISAPAGVDPTQLTFVSSDIIPGTQTAKQWTVSVAGKTRDGQTLYYLNKANDAQDDVRVQYSVNGSSVTNDQFDPNTVKDLYEDYTATLYTGAVTLSSVRAIDGNGTEYGIRTGEGTLRVRAVDLGSGTPETNPVYLVQSALPTERLAAGTAAVVAPEGTTYVLNHTTVPAGPDGIGLLFDDIYDKDNGQSLRENALIAQADAKIGPAAANVTRWHQAKYLDLVDENNGNAWVKTTGQPVTVVWAYPEGTDANTSFTLLHFEGLHRDDADQASSGYTVSDITAVDPTRVSIRKTAAGIEFDVPSGGFSPFVLIWEKANPAASSETTSVSAPQTGDSAQPAVLVSVAALSVGAAVAIVFTRRRRR